MQCVEFLIKIGSRVISRIATIHSTLVSVYRHNILFKNKANGNDINFSVQLSSLRLCADDTTAYASNTDISALELSLNKDLENLSSWFASNYLSVNSKKTQAMILGKHSHEPALHIGDSVIDISGFLNILGVCIDDKLTFKDHLSTVLRKVYAKVGALRRLRKLVPADISLMLYKAYIYFHTLNIVAITIRD